MHARHGRAVFQGIPKVGAGAGADFRYASVSIVISVRYYAVDEMCELATIPTDLETSGTSVGALGGQSLGARRGSISALSPSARGVGRAGEAAQRRPGWSTASMWSTVAERWRGGWGRRCQSDFSTVAHAVFAELGGTRDATRARGGA
jgi:hypothetical protein